MIPYSAAAAASVVPSIVLRGADPSRAGEAISGHDTREEGPRVGLGVPAPTSRKMRLAQGELTESAQQRNRRVSNRFIAERGSVVA